MWRNVCADGYAPLTHPAQRYQLTRLNGSPQIINITNNAAAHTVPLPLIHIKMFQFTHIETTTASPPAPYSHSVPGLAKSWCVSCIPPTRQQSSCTLRGLYRQDNFRASPGEYANKPKHSPKDHGVPPVGTKPRSSLHEGVCCNGGEEYMLILQICECEKHSRSR